MEKKGTILDYIGQVLLIYGGTMVVMNICTFLVGEDAQEISSLFSLGSNGMSVAVSFQFLLVAILNTALRFLFMTDAIIKKMSLTGRAACLLPCGDCGTPFGAAEKSEKRAVPSFWVW